MSPRLHHPCLVPCLLLGIYAVVAGVFVLNANVNADEGFYPASAQAVAQGLMPYRDFGYTQPPVLPYVYAGLMRATGFGVLQMRALNAALGAGTLVLLLLLVRRTNPSPWREGLVGSALLLSAAAVYFTVVGKTYALAGFALVAGAAALLPHGPAWRRFGWLAFWGTVAVGTRLNMAPAVVVLWVGLVVQLRRRTPWIAALGAPALGAALVFAPFALADLANLRFWIWDYHLLDATPDKPWSALWESVTFAPVIGGLGLAGALAVVFERRFDARFWWLAAGLGGWIVGVVTSGVYGEYAAPFWPLTLAGAAALLPDGTFRKPFLYIGAAVVLLLAAMGFASFSGAAYRPWLKPGYLAAIDASADVLRRYTSPGGTIVSSMPEVPLRAGRPIPPELVMGKFSFTAEIDPERAKRLHLLDRKRLIEWIDSGEPEAIVLTQSEKWSFGLSMPSVRGLPRSAYTAWLQALHLRYSLIREDRFFVVFVRSDLAGSRGWREAPVPRRAPEP